MKYTVTIALALLLAWPAFAQQTDSTARKTFSINASLWTRGEFRDGALPAENGADYAVFLMSNNVLRFNYSGNYLEARVSPKFFGIWGAKGSGAVAAMPLLDMALAVWKEGYTFAEGGIEPYKYL